MGLATLATANVFTGKSLQRWVRAFFIASGLMVPIIAWVYCCPVFSTSLLLLPAPWMVTTPGSILLLTLYFAHEGRAD